MTSSFTEQYTGLYATPELVGRVEIVKKFERILRADAKTPKLVFISGLGGIGKTRLLKKTLETAKTVANCRVAEDVLDFYHIETHTTIGLTQAIFEILTPPYDCFQTYQPAYNALNRARLSGNVVELDKLRQDAADKFDQDMKQLSVSCRVVLTLDTAERVVYGLSGWTDEIPLAESWDWLIEKIQGWGNVIVFVAGREEARPAIEKLKTSHPALVEEIEVGPFSEAESLQYFDTVSQLLEEKKDHHLAERLRNLPLSFKKGAHAYSSGRPILLSLFVDYLSFPGESKVPVILHETPPTHVKNDDYRRFEAALFDRLREGELGETLVALGRLPKGADDELLAALLDVHRAEARKRLDDVKRLSVVKIRPEDQRVFLHDEMYALLQRQVYDSSYDAEKQKTAFDAIKKYYFAQRGRIIERLNELYAPLEEQGREALDLKILGEVHAQYQNLLTEIMYYYLRQDLDRGFRAYYRYSHEAIMARDVPMDLHLQAELLSYLSRPAAPVLEKEISVDLLLANLKTREPARAWALGGYEDGLNKAHDLLQAFEKDWQKRFPSLLAAVNVWAAGLHIMRGKKDENDYEEAEKHLSKVYLLLPEKDVQAPFEELTNISALLWYKKAIYAMARRAHGYLRRVQGLMKDSVAEYQRAATILREIDLRIEMATTMNDMGFTQSELGEWHDARANVKHALKLRRELGPRIPVALSLNTLAAIDVREGQYLSAKENSERALSIFRAFLQERGIAMALTTLSEALRRLAGTTPLLSDEERIQWLREARDYALEANSLFRQSGETARQVEALIELGCACRDWIRWLKKSSRPGDSPERLFSESKEAFKKAADLAGKNGLTYRHVDALVNLAWLDYYLLDEKEPVDKDHAIWKAIDHAEAAFPEEIEIEKQPQVWAQKGKLNILKGHLAYREFIQQRQKKPKGIYPEIETVLKQMGENYARGLDYGSRFASDYQGIRQAKNGISERLMLLNAAEMRVVCNQIHSLYPQISIIETLLTNRALWQIG
ncbi:MAG: ATP-binding protein [Anaerolineales bacterium]|nr:ATP-binding protein [Anaerolineales bacterium]MCZ2288887.1 tetratricopeptide repeat protein [Anaerolineales bacterium]